MKTKAHYHYPLRLDWQDSAAVAEVARKTGQSINSVLVMSIQKGLPLAQEALARPPRRVTAVDPLPEQVLREACAAPDELQGVSPRRLAKFQTQTEPQ